jgi:hypothetical protein
MSEEYQADKYGKIRCITCGCPWFSFDSLRWPLHPSGTTCYQYRPKHPIPLSDKEVTVNLKGTAR